MKERNDYEIRAEIIVNQLKSKIYKLEAKAMEAKLNAKSGIGDLEKEIQSLQNQRDQLDQKFNELKSAGKDRWELLVSEFEKFLETINADKQDFMEKSESWLHEVNEKIDELEEKAKTANDELKEKIKEQIENLKEHKDHLEKKMNEFKESQNENLESIKHSFEESLKVAKDAIKKAFDYIRE